MSNRYWTLKILAGIHAGAEVTLSDDDAVVGSADECDFVLEDAGVAPRHFALRPGEGTVRLTVLDSDHPILVAGMPIEESADLSPYEVVSCGALALAMGPADEDWPPIDLPGAERAEPEGERVPGVADEGSAQSDDALEPENKDAGVAATRRRRTAWAGATFASALLIAVGAWMAVPRQVERQHEDPAEAVEDIRRIAARHAAIVQLRADADRVVVTGIVDTERARDRLLRALADSHHRAVVHITSTEKLAGLATTILDQSVNSDERNEVEVVPVAGSPGQLLVSGYVEEDASLTLARTLIERDINEARAFTYAVQTRQQRIELLREQLDESGYRHLHIQRLEDGLGLFGPIDGQGDLARLHELVGQFNEEFESRPRLAISGTDTLLGESTIHLDIRAVVLGENAHVVLHDGTNAGEGATVPGGYVVDTIAERYMILETPAHRIEVEATDADKAYFIFEGG